MRIVIDIPEEYYNVIKEIADEQSTADMLIIKHGTPLPKGHGRLIDADELYDEFIDGTEGYDCHPYYKIDIGEIIDDAETVIPADKRMKNDERKQEKKE